MVKIINAVGLNKRLLIKSGKVVDGQWSNSEWAMVKRETRDDKRETTNVK